MFLQKMELQGFKTFAQKTTLEFPGPSKDQHALTVVVGPNGSGKSNLSDAIRWCLGEQSMKLLRGKRTEDIIFSGSEGRGRSGFAEVTLVFNNEDKSLEVDFAEVTITRRLYRDGESEYLMNGQTARLSDIQLLLAEAGVGQRTYSVIGQGMIDHVLTSSPEERKIFFDDATGVRGFQIKRHQSILKLQKSAENLSDVEMLLREIEPRLNLLRRQVKRLNEREKTELELREVSAAYYGTLWWNAVDEKRAVEKRITEAKQRVETKKTELHAGDEKLLAMEAKEVGGGQERSGEIGGTQALQDAYKVAQQELSASKTVLYAAERELELARVRAQSTWSPLPLTDIVSEVRDITSAHEGLLRRLRAITAIEEIDAIASELEVVFGRSKKLKDRLTKPNPDDFTADPVMVTAIESAKTRVKTAEGAVHAAEQAMDTQAKQATESRTEVFTFQRELRRLQQELSAFEAQANTVSIDLARLETRMEGLEKEMQDSVPGGYVAITAEPPKERVFEIGQTHDRMMRLRHQLELIGGIDDDVIKEHKEAEERFTFLATQVSDLRAAIASTEKIVDELDEQIRKQSEAAFKLINTEFQKYFKVLFGGGSCSLVKMSKEDVDNESAVTPDRAIEEVAAKEVAEREEESAEKISERVKERKDAIVGIDIQATPPGKKLKALNLLSGGERALTSIALLSAIMATNPSPFVVLDEVDAALDEANTVRFANILNELRKLTQFIVVTHNRATMEKGDVLYGVTMGDDGVSKLLSVKLEDYTGGGTARR
ncbi:MAG: AAA family ATPase [Candidatus Uhrbacteria bacterium]|nr:AAA family ATPase [Candidatus Uhrbacteria bacterium]